MPGILAPSFGNRSLPQEACYSRAYWRQQLQRYAGMGGFSPLVRLYTQTNIGLRIMPSSYRRLSRGMPTSIGECVRNIALAKEFEFEDTVATFLRTLRGYLLVPKRILKLHAIKKSYACHKGFMKVLCEIS